MPSDIVMPTAEPDSQDQAFVGQMIRQLYAELDAVLVENRDSVDDAFAMASEAALAARPRGAVLLILARSALAAQRALMSGSPPVAETVADAEAGAVLVISLPGSAAQLPALMALSRRLMQDIATAENAAETIDAPLARAITRFCTALAEEDAGLGRRSLLEVRAMLVHMDAVAMALESNGAMPAPRRMIRPDRFHDYFTRYVELARTPAVAADGARAALTNDGRLSAVIAADRHPLEAAAQTLRAAIVGDETTRDHALARIHALLEFIDDLRDAPDALIGDPLKDETVHLSLVIAAATAPLHAARGFGFSELAQVARYNQMLLAGNMATVSPAP